MYTVVIKATIWANVFVVTLGIQFVEQGIKLFGLNGAPLGILKALNCCNMFSQYVFTVG